MHNAVLMGWDWHWRTVPVPSGWEWQIFKRYSGGQENMIFSGTAATKTAADMLAKQQCDSLIRGEISA